MPFYRVSVDPDWVAAYQRDELRKEEEREGYKARPLPETSGIPAIFNACDPDHAIRQCRVVGTTDTGPCGIIAEEVEVENPILIPATQQVKEGPTQANSEGADGGPDGGGDDDNQGSQE